jgi:DNA-binding LacI/PurR family transcriptional regulator
MAGAATGARRQRPTLREVAAAAGVSTATVSRALRDDPQISLPTREAVKRIAAELQYVPNAAARSLASSSSRMLGLIVPDVTDPVHGQVVQGFESTAMQHGYTVVIANSAYDPQLELAALRVFAANLVEGTATFGGMLHPAAVGSEALGNVVYLNPEDPGALAVAPERGLITIDDVGGIEDAVRTAAGMGNRRLGFVAGPVRASCVRRRDAVLRAAAELGLSPVLVIEAEDVPLADVAARLREARLDVVLCYDDQRALRLLDALRAEGLRVPEDLGVIGFDDIPQAAISNPRLTTISVPHPEMGRRAAEALIAGKRGELPPSAQVPARLVVRESLGPPTRA